MAQALILYPRSLTELAKHAVHLYIHNLRVILLAVLAYLIAVIVAAVAGMLILALDFGLLVMSQSQGLFVVIGIGGILLMVALMGIGMAYVSAAAIVAITLNLRGLQANVGQIRRYLGRSVILQLIITNILQSVATWFGLVLLILPGIIAFAWFAFAEPIVVIERRAYVSALLRSRDLVRGQTLRILAAILALEVVDRLTQIIGEAVLGLALSATLALTITSITLLFLYTPFQFIFETLLYYDARVRKGELGLEEISERI